MHYRRQQAERQAFEKAQESTFGRLRYWLKNRHIDRFGGEAQDRQGLMARAFQVAINRDHMQAALTRKHEAERKALSARQDEYTRKNVDEIHRATGRILAEVREKQAAERKEQLAAQLRQREEEARRKALGADKPAFDFKKAADHALRRPDPYFGPGAKDPFTQAAGKEPGKEQREAQTRPEIAKDFERAADPARTPEPEPEKAPEAPAEKQKFSMFRDTLFETAKDPQTTAAPDPEQDKAPGEPEEGKEKKFSVFRDHEDEQEQDNPYDKGRERKGPGEREDGR